jgi:hypothetical protein
MCGAEIHNTKEANMKAKVTTTESPMNPYCEGCENMIVGRPDSEASLVASPHPVPAKSDFISMYAAYADVFEMPREVHEWMAALMIAAVLNGKVWIDWGTKVPLDLWVLLLSGSGQGRNTATDVAVGVMEKANIPGLLRKAAWGSKAAFYQQMADHPRGLYIWPELSVALKTLNDPKFGGVKEWTTDRYDNLRAPEPIVYRKTGKKSDTPPIIFGEAPRINILATSSSDWFINNLDQADTLGGFIPRWLPKDIGKSERVIPKPLAPDANLLPALAEKLRSIAKLEGYSDLSAVEDAYGEWYTAAKQRFGQQPNTSLADPFFHRLRNELLKLAVIFEVSQSGTIVVTPEAFGRAVAAVSQAEETIFKLLPSGMTREGSEVERIAEKIRQAGRNGISRSELTRAFQHVKQKDRDERLRTLVEVGRIREITRQTAGRSVKVYFHDHYFAAAAAEEGSEQAG